MKRLLLAGAGHSQLFVLRALARRPVPDLDVTLIAPYDRQLYSGMLPGWIAGHYALDEISIDLRPLAEAARARLILDRVTGLDLDQRQVLTECSAPFDFDLLSLATGSSIAAESIEGAHSHALALRPTHGFVAAWEALAPRLARADRARLTVVGAGAAGMEVAMAAAYALRGMDGRAEVRILSGGAVLPGHGPGVRERVRRELARANVEVIDAIAARIASDHVLLADGNTLPSDLTLLASGAAPPAWLPNTGLALDDAGFIAVDSYLRSVSHPSVFAAGDIAAMVGVPRARSGVYAVRSGPPLADNLIRQMLGRSLRSYTPRRVALSLLAMGPRRAVLSWNGLSSAGEWVWRWKDRIDRRFIAMFRRGQSP
jgi:pyridine nucleotide-disulfide oxidoreductase family protein